MSNLVMFAEDEMRRAGLYDKDADYGGEIPQAVMALVRAHSAQGHSGVSSAIVLQIFNKVINFTPLSPVTSDPSEWTEVSDGMWQSKRNYCLFSRDGGKTWYDVDAPKSQNGGK